MIPGFWRLVENPGFAKKCGDVPVEPGDLEGLDHDQPVEVRIAAQERDPERAGAQDALDLVLVRGPDGVAWIDLGCLPQLGEGFVP